ncbi:MAG: endo-1,4-beta-xylanase, partial [Flavicella sp.]
WAEELYDYNNDPLETTNQVKNKSYHSIYKKMKAHALQYFQDQEKSKKNLSVVKSYKPLKDLLSNKFNSERVYLGATLNHRQLNTSVSDLFLRHFTYTTPENCAKQSRVHPKPDYWDWKQIDTYLAFAKENNLSVRIHGPISPQASKWAKADHRTPEELSTNMTEYFTALCKRFNDNNTVKWMDVVNETVNRDGTWFAEKKGVNSWENPWTQIGMDAEGVPLYIGKAFEIANKHATNKSLVFNQHGGMEPVMWERVKKTILHLKEKGYRVDGLGWQAHLKSTEKLAFDAKDMRYFSELIDWAHANELDFHVTEIDYKIWDGKASPEALKLQAAAFANILKVLLSKRNSGVVTYNTWGMVDGTGKHHDKHLFLFDQDGNPKPAFYAVQASLQNPNQPLVIKK